MEPVGKIVQELFDVLHAKSDEAMQARIWRVLNREYFELCAEVSWHARRANDPVELDFSAASDTTGLWLPSDLLGIDIVWDDDNDVEFFETSRSATVPDEWGYRCFRYWPSRSHLFSGTDLVLNTGATTFTSATLTAAGTSVDGEYVQFDSEPGMYKITDDSGPFTFEPTYYGPKKTQKFFKIRPWEYSQKLNIVDPSEDKLTDRTVDVYYWRMPVPLYREEDVVLLPSTEVLKLRTLRSIPQAKERYPVSERMLDAAFQRAAKLNPTFSRVRSARDKHYQRIDFSKNPFDQR